MLHICLQTLLKKLSNHLKLSLLLNEDIVSLNSLNNTIAATPINKVVISLVNIERETAGGINFSYQGGIGNQYNQNLPAWQLNLYVLISGVFSDKQYEESLQILSSILYFLQSNKNLTLEKTDIQLSIEPVNVAFNELSNLWSIFGGTYYPSILCKLRTLNINNNEIRKLLKPIIEKETGYE